MVCDDFWTCDLLLISSASPNHKTSFHVLFGSSNKAREKYKKEEARHCSAWRSWSHSERREDGDHHNGIPTSSTYCLKQRSSNSFSSTQCYKKDGLGACCQRTDPHNNMKMSLTTLLQRQNSFFANGWVLRDRQVSLSKRLKFFDAIVSRLDTERFTSLTFTGWMLKARGCFVQWWGHPETSHGMTHGMKFFMLGTTKFGTHAVRTLPLVGRSNPWQVTGNWLLTLQICLVIDG